MYWTIFVCSVDGRIVRAPIMMAKSHKRALYYTVVEIRIRTYTHRKTLSLQRNYGGPMPPKHFMYILLGSQFLYVILSWLWWAVFSVALLPQDALSMYEDEDYSLQEIFFWKPQEIVSHSLSFQMFLRKSFVFQWRWVSDVLPEF